jgi:hypothetical protein
VLLLHGTKPEAVHPILWQGLDPQLAKDGLFGCGTYLAEDAAKADQYCTVDAAFCGNNAALRPLHNKLYAKNVKHGGDVFYALVCRAVLGAPASTRDGRTVLAAGGAGASDGGVGAGAGGASAASTRLFENAERRSLAGGAHALLAEKGDVITRFREVVVFNPAAIDVVYLVALKRERYYCDCGLPASRRTVVNNSNGNAGRPILFCDKGDADPGKCTFLCMLPLCHCGRSAELATAANGAPYYRCGMRRGFCVFKGAFKDWPASTGGGGAGAGSPSKRPREGDSGGGGGGTP